jgi:hypothetical protein
VPAVQDPLDASILNAVRRADEPSGPGPGDAGAPATALAGVLSRLSAAGVQDGVAAARLQHVMAAFAGLGRAPR